MNTKDSVLLNFARSLHGAVTSIGGAIAFLSQVDAQTHIEHDIDCVVSQRVVSGFAQVMDDLEGRTGFQLTQCIAYDVAFSRYCVFCRIENGRTTCVKIDFIHDPSGMGAYAIRTDLLLEAALDPVGLPRPLPTVELAYQLSKRAAKGKLDESGYLKLSAIRSGTQGSRTQLYDTLSLSLPRWLLCRMLNQLDAQDFVGLQRSIRLAPILMQAYRLLRFPLRFLRTRWMKMGRILDRISRPVGLVAQLPQSINIDYVQSEEFLDSIGPIFRNRVRIVSRIGTPMGHISTQILLARGYLIIRQTSRLDPGISDDHPQSTLRFQSDLLKQLAIRAKQRMKSSDT